MKMYSATRPSILIEEGEELRVSPLQPFKINCNVTRSDPIPTITWEHKWVFILGGMLSSCESHCSEVVRWIPGRSHCISPCKAEVSWRVRYSLALQRTKPARPQRRSILLWRVRHFIIMNKTYERGVWHLRTDISGASSLPSRREQSQSAMDWAQDNQRANSGIRCVLYRRPFSGRKRVEGSF